MAKRKTAAKAAAGKRGIIEKIGPVNFTVLSFVLAWIGQAYMYYRDGGVKAGLFYLLLSAAALVLAAVAARTAPDTGGHAPEMGRAAEFALFLLILATAVFVRLYKIDSIPAGCFVDEATNGQDAIDIMQGQKLPVYKGNPTHNPTMYLYMIIFVFKFFGWGCVQVREASAILGILAVPAFYFLLRYMFGPFTAVLGGLLLATMRWHINFSRIGFHGIFGVFAVIITLYFLWRAYRERKWQDFIFLGIALGLSQYTYQPARLLPFSIALFCVYLVFRDGRFFVQEWKKLVVAVLLSVVVFAPLGAYMFRNISVFMHRQNEVSLLNKKLVGDWYMGKFTRLQAVMFSAKTTMLMFTHKGDFNARHNLPGYPMLDFATGIMAFSGLVLAVAGFADPLKFLLFVLFAGFLQAGFLSIEAPQGLRLIMLTPVVLLFAALYIRTVMGFAASRYGRVGRMAAAVVLSALVFWAAVANIDVYFNRQAKFRDCWGHFSTFAAEAGKYLKAQGGGVQASMMMPAYEMRTVEFILRGAAQPRPHVYQDPNSVLNAPFDRNAGKDYVFILPWNTQVIFDSFLSREYPGGRYTRLANPFNEKEFYYAYRVPYEVMAAAAAERGKRGFSARYYAGMDWAGSPVVARVEPFIFQDWGMGPVYSAFSAEWSGEVRAQQTGEYTFSYQSSGYAELWIDGKQVSVSQKGQNGAAVKARLRSGAHSVRFRMSNADYYSNSKLYWQKPGETGFSLVCCEDVTPG